MIYLKKNKAAGCCQFITDETSNEFLTYCTADCVQTNFAMMCNPNYTVGDNANVDVYSIDEAYKAGSGGTKELNYSCIVDIAGGKIAVDNTNKLADAAGIVIINIVQFLVKKIGIFQHRLLKILLDLMQ